FLSPVEIGGPANASHHLLQKSLTEAFSSGRGHDRSASFGPAQLETVLSCRICPLQPFNSNSAGGIRKGAVFGGICSQFMQDHADILRSRRLEGNIGAAAFDSTICFEERVQVDIHELPYRDRAPSPFGQNNL